MKRATFTLGDDEFSGWSGGQLWNGWECPFFETESALAIVAMLNRWYPESARMESGSIVVELDGERDEFTSQTIETPEGFKTAYAIGSGAWCWQSV